MAKKDPHDEPANETPAERRERLLNLNNPEWGASSAAKAVEEADPAKAEADESVKSASKKDK